MCLGRGEVNEIRCFAWFMADGADPIRRPGRSISSAVRLQPELCSEDFEVGTRCWSV